MTKPHATDLSKLSSDELADYRKRKEEREEAAERKRVAAMSDAEVLEQAGGFGPAIIGKILYERAASVRLTTNDGEFGPALTDPDYGKKEAAKRAERRAGNQAAAEEQALLEGKLPDHDRRDEGEGDEEGATVDPWSFVTLSGAKMLAQHAGVSHKPGVKRQALIAVLQKAGVTPPEPPANPDADDDE